MALTTFGASVDILAGGADLRYPHHVQQAALAEAATGVRPFARAELRAGLVEVAGRKMAKSAGNLVLLTDLLASGPAPVVRLLVLDRRWDQPWGYTPAAMEAAAVRLDELYAAAGRPDRRDASGAVLDALGDDLDVPTAVEIAIAEGGAAARLLLALLGLR